MIQPRIYKIAIWYIGILFLIALIAPWIANEKPFYCKLENESYYPVFSGINESTLSNLHPAHSPVNWYSTSFDKIIRTPIPYSASTIDLKTGKYKSPFSSADKMPVHLLGTDSQGRDVMAGMVRGARVSMLIGFGSMLIALLIGVPLGGIAGWNYYPGERNWIDTIFMVWITVIDGFPAIFLIVVLAAILPWKGWLMVTLVIAFLKWPTIARYTRAEVMKLKTTSYVRSARLLNFPSFMILKDYVIPYAVRPVMVSFIFGVASAIVAESSLSFLGLGMPVHELNWGRLLAESRHHASAWWLIVFPGLAIFGLILSLYVVGSVWEKDNETVGRL